MINYWLINNPSVRYIAGLVSGLVWDQWGATVLFIFASCCTVVAMGIVWKFIQVPDRSF